MRHSIRRLKTKFKKYTNSQLIVFFMSSIAPLIEEKIKSLKGPIFIFGASGFIGANLLESILRYRKDCYALTHDVKQAWRLKLMNVSNENVLYCDILFKNSVIELFDKYKPETVFNLSAYGAYSKQDDANLIYETNLIGTLNILRQ